MTKLTRASDVTDADAYALSAIENNPNVEGTMRRAVSTLWEHVTNDIDNCIFKQLHYYPPNNVNPDAFTKYADNPGNVTGNKKCIYALLIHDGVGADDYYGGGTTMFFGFTYGYTVDNPDPSGNMYDVQIAIRCNWEYIMYRSRSGKSWLNWRRLAFVK